MEETKFSGWGLVEILGHVRVAGRLGERSIAGTNLLQVDIPLSDEPDHFRTQFVGGGSIYALHPTDEETARALAKRLGTKPTYAYDVEQQLRLESKPAADPTIGGQAQVVVDDDTDEDEEDFSEYGEDD